MPYCAVREVQSGVHAHAKVYLYFTNGIPLRAIRVFFSFFVHVCVFVCMLYNVLMRKCWFLFSRFLKKVTFVLVLCVCVCVCVCFVAVVVVIFLLFAFGNH